MLIHIEMIRKMRNKALVESDAWMLPDRGLTNEQINELEIYRQALRDYPESIDWNNEVAEIDELNFPVKPEWMI